MKLGYLEKYEESKLGQHMLRNEMVKTELRESKQNLEFEIDKELKVHIEIEKYLSEASEVKCW